MASVPTRVLDAQCGGLASRSAPFSHKWPTCVATDATDCWRFGGLSTWTAHKQEESRGCGARLLASLDSLGTVGSPLFDVWDGSEWEVVADEIAGSDEKRWLIELGAVPIDTAATSADLCHVGWQPKRVPPAQTLCFAYRLFGSAPSTPITCRSRSAAHGFGAWQSRNGRN